MLCHVFWSQVEYKIVCFILLNVREVIRFYNLGKKKVLKQTLVLSSTKASSCHQSFTAIIIVLLAFTFI